MKRREKKSGFWLPLIIIFLIAGSCWVGYREYETQKSSARLFEALREENTAAVQSALDAGADLNARQMFGDEQPASLVARIRLLLLEALHPADSETALSEAAQTENPEIVHLLLNRGALPNLRNGDGSTALMAAANDIYYGAPADIQHGLQKQKQVMLLLLSNGADVNAKDRQGDDALQKSVSGNFNGIRNLTAARFLLEHGADVDAKDSSGETLLQWAVGYGDKSTVPLVGLLLDHGANANAMDRGGWTPLMRASELMEPSLVQTLINHGANLNSHSPANDMTPLIQAARQGQVGMIKLLLAKGADVNAFSQYDSTALFVAAQHKRADIVKILLDHGANPNYVNKFEMREPALTVAAGNQDVPSVKLLIAHGADVNPGGEEDTPLTAAANTYLINSYARRHKNVWNPGDVLGILPASPPGGITITRLLLAAGADANKPNEVGNAALVYAVAGHNLPLVCLLMAHGADPTAPGSNSYVPESAGETPLSIATKRGYSDLTPLL